MITFVILVLNRSSEFTAKRSARLRVTHLAKIKKNKTDIFT